MISVIIPAYNAAKTIGMCVKSILHSADGYVSFEIIVVNDGSTDQTDNICRELCKLNKEIKYFVKKNGGVSSARNYGLMKASGEYICFVDADDSVSECYLAVLQNVASLADITFFGFDKCDISSGKHIEMTPNVYSVTGIKDDREQIIAYLLSNSTVNFFGFTWSKVFRTDIINDNNIRFNTDLKIKEDEIFTLEYCRYISTIQVLDKTLYSYNIFENSLSHSKTKIRYDILASDYLSLALTFENNNLREVLYGIAVSYGLGQARELKRENNSKREVIDLISKRIIPLLKKGYGINSARWMPFVRSIHFPRLQAEMIYRMLK